MRILPRLGELFVRVLILALGLSAVDAVAQQRIDIAVIYDGPGDRLEDQRQFYIDELLALAAREFDVQIRSFPGNWTSESIEAAFDAAYADDEIDMLLITGFISSQIGDGFHVYPVFADLAFKEDLSPLLMFDYAAPKKFSAKVGLMYLRQFHS